MPRLSQFQIEMLVAAARRADGLAPFPRNPTRRQSRLIADLIVSNLLQVRVSTGNTPCWRRDGLGRPLCLKITRQGFRLIAGATVRPNRPTKSATRDNQEHSAQPDFPILEAIAQPQPRPRKLIMRSRHGAAAEPQPQNVYKTKHRSTKMKILLNSLQHPDGITISELCQKLDWQRHSVRAAISRQIRRRLRLTVTSETIKGRGRVLKVKDATAVEFLKLLGPNISSAIAVHQ
ncbi:MAG: DUF3489 domain-containing protein [Alphaproteobacteria bacterium]